MKTFFLNVLIFVLHLPKYGLASVCELYNYIMINSRVPDQNGVFQACYIVEIYHSGPKPSYVALYVPPNLKTGQLPKKKNWVLPTRKVNLCTKFKQSTPKITNK